MGGIDMVIELALVAFLAATLLQAIRLQRALASLRQDRTALDDAVSAFDSGTRQAEAGLSRLREAADRLTGQLGQATALRDDLAYLSDRGEGLADRLDTLVRAGRAVEPPMPPVAYGYLDGPAPGPINQVPAQAAVAHAPVGSADPAAPTPRVRSAAERHLMAAMQARR